MTIYIVFPIWKWSIWSPWLVSTGCKLLSFLFLIWFLKFIWSKSIGLLFLFQIFLFKFSHSFLLFDLFFQKPCNYIWISAFNRTRFWVSGHKVLFKVPWNTLFVIWFLSSHIKWWCTGKKWLFRFSLGWRVIKWPLFSGFGLTQPVDALLLLNSSLIGWFFFNVLQFWTCTDLKRHVFVRGFFLLHGTVIKLLLRTILFKSLLKLQLMVFIFDPFGNHVLTHFKDFIFWNFHQKLIYAICVRKQSIRDVGFLFVENWLHQIGSSSWLCTNLFNQANLPYVLHKERISQLSILINNLAFEISDVNAL